MVKLVNNEYTSNAGLFHFVGHSSPNDEEKNFEILKIILSSGCISHPPHDGCWGKTSYKITYTQDSDESFILEDSLINEKLIVPNITCYADIPLSSLGIHIQKYGKFGLSLPRDLLIECGARPVMYIPMWDDDWRGVYGTVLLKNLEAVYKGYCQHIKSLLGSQTTYSSTLGTIPENKNEAIKRMDSAFVKDFLAYIKPFNSKLDANDPNNFYMEREWRKFGNMKFENTQVERIIVAKGFKKRLIDDLKEFNDEQIIEV